MFEVVSQIIICLILAALLGAIIGYLIGQSNCSKNHYHKTEKNPHELHIDNKISEKNSQQVEINKQKLGTQPILLSQARAGGKDNLQLIKGVGVVLEKVLNEIGIYHFDQIANLTPDEVLWIDTSIAFPGRIERESWVSQAKDLAEGKQTEFSTRVQRNEVPTSRQS